MLAQRPVVAARAGGVIEIIEDGVDGLLCEPGDASDLANTLTRLQSHASLRDRLVTAGYRTALQRFGTDNYVSGVERILTKVAGKA
jgi:glycosyltransferase involved in cell wall biosynthesis